MSDACINEDIHLTAVGLRSKRIEMERSEIEMAFEAVLANYLYEVLKVHCTAHNGTATTKLISRKRLIR